MVTHSTQLAPSAADGAAIEVDGLETFYHDVGSGPPLLLLHGSGPGVSAWSNWRPVYPALSAAHRVIAPDQLGFGRTAAPRDGCFGRVAWTRHAFALMDRLGIDSFDVIGNSMGGAIALAMARERPEAIGRIVLMGAMGIDMKLPEGLDAVWGYDPSPDAMRRLISLFAYDQSIVTDELVEMRYQASIGDGIQESFAAMFPAPRQRWVDDLALPRADLERVEQPVLLVHGFEDPIIPIRDSSIELMRLLPDARLHVLGHCGHWAMIEHTEAFNRLVLDFLDRSGAGA